MNTSTCVLYSNELNTMYIYTCISANQDRIWEGKEGISDYEMVSE